MQNAAGNPNQQMYYQQQQQQQQSQGGGQMGMTYLSNVTEQQRQQQQQHQSMMGIQGAVMNTQSNSPNISNQQLYATNQHMQNVPQQRTFASRLPQNQQPQPQMYASPSSSNVNALQSYQQNETQSQNAMITPPQQQQQQQYAQQPQNIPPSASYQQLPTQRIAEPRKEEPRNVRPLNPPPYSPEILNNLSKYSVWSLSMIGRELVQELILRTQMLMNLLLKLTDRRYQQQSASDPEQLLEYCQMILTRIVEIRLRIDRVTIHQKRISEDDFIAMMSDPTTPQKPPQQIQKEQIFEAQRHKLVKLSSALKSFEWMCSVSDPRLLEKPQKL